jgi:hypothetical protein
MKQEMKVLLVSKKGSDASYLQQQLDGFRCSIAHSADDIVSALEQHVFDLILSATWIQDELLAKLADSKSTLFFSYPVRNSCWWLPVLHRGEQCLGEPALRPNEFARLIRSFAGKRRAISAAAA